MNLYSSGKFNSFTNYRASEIKTEFKRIFENFTLSQHLYRIQNKELEMLNIESIESIGYRTICDVYTLKRQILHIIQNFISIRFLEINIHLKNKNTCDNTSLLQKNVRIQNKMVSRNCQNHSFFRKSL